MNRRAFLTTGLRGVGALGVAKALDNTVVGYGHFGLGESLLDQPLNRLALERFPSFERFDIDVGDGAVRSQDGTLEAHRGDGAWERVGESIRGDDIDDVIAGVRDLRSHRFTFSFLKSDDFFEVLATGQPRPILVELLRKWFWDIVDPVQLEAAIGADPADPAAVVPALAETFARTTQYDVPRYIAGSIEDNVLPIHLNLRDPFRSTISFDRLDESDPISLFCSEFAFLANLAFRAVPPREQHPPVTGLRVVNRRHKHVYNGLASVVDTPEGLVVPVTFVDYTNSTFYADTKLDRIVGTKVDAYDRWHRTDGIYW